MGRLSINRTDDWHVKHDRQDIRGWPVRDASGDVVGHVRDLIADTDTKMVETIVLDSGTEYPARDIELSDGSVYLEEVPAGAAASAAYDRPVIRERERGVTTGFAEHEPRFKEHYQTSFADTGNDYSHYNPAYRLGYEYGIMDDYRNRTWDEVEPEVRSRFEETREEGGWLKVRDAARHAFNHVRKGTTKPQGGRATPSAATTSSRPAKTPSKSGTT